MKYVDDIIGVVSKYGNKVIKVFAQHGDKVFKWAAKYGDEVIAWLTKQGNKVTDLTDDVLEKVFGKKAKKELGEETSEELTEKALKSKQVEEPPAPKNSDGTANLHNTQADSGPVRDASVRNSGHIESNQLSDKQINNELDYINDHRELVEGVSPNRKVNIGEHEWHEQLGGAWCRHSSGKVCTRREDIDEALSELKQRHPDGATAIMPPDSKNVLAGDPLPERILDDNGSLIPLGFKSASDYKAFSSELDQGLKSAGFDDAQPVFQGSSVTGFKGFDSYDRRRGNLKRSAGTIFDTGSDELSDFDIAISSLQILAKAKGLGIPTRSKGTRALLQEDALEELGLDSLVKSLSSNSGREVHFMVFDSMANITNKKDTYSIIPNIDK